MNENSIKKFQSTFEYKLIYIFRINDKAHEGWRAMSATNDNRPEFQRMISDSYLDRFDAVLIWKSDRFSRNRKQAICYRDILRENHVKLLSATEPNIEGPAGILFESMNDGYNEYQRNDRCFYGTIYIFL